MPAKFCETCDKDLILKTKRDRQRKRFCSRSCLGKWTAANRDPELLKQMQKAAHTSEAKIKRSNSLSGKNNPRYIKDRSKVIKRPMEGAWRKAVFEKDNYTCKVCEQYGGKLNAHHVAPYKEFPQFREEVNNGKALCEPCHKEVHAVAKKILYASY